MDIEPESDPNPTDRGPHLSRRRFIALGLMGAASVLVEGCRRVLPSETPTPTLPSPSASATGRTPPSATATGAAGGSAQYLPHVGSGGGATATPAATASATPASATATPQPTATPRPLATPFPPGPPTRLGLFLGYQHPVLEQLLNTGNVPFVKTLEYDPNLMEFIKQRSPETLLVARYTPLGQINLAEIDPIATARQFVEFLLPIATEPKRWANIDAWEAYNEPVAGSAEEMKRLADFEAERTRLLAAEGIRSCIGNFAAGTPELALWPAFLPALEAIQAHDGLLGLHEYSAPYMWFGSGANQLEAGRDEGDTGWFTLRYRKVYRQYLEPAGLRVPLVITETGIDGGIAPRPGPPGLGWQDFVELWQREGHITSSGAGFYMEQLAWYDAELRKDPYVLGASIFALAGPVGWGSFEILGDMVPILEQYFSVHPAG